MPYWFETGGGTSHPALHLDIWVFLIVGIVALFGLVSEPVAALAFYSWGVENLREFQAADQAISSVAAVALCARAAMSLGPRRWKLCLIALGLMLLCLALNDACRGLQHVGLLGQSGWFSQHLVSSFGNMQFVFTAMVVTAAITDAARKVRRDWLHHLAIVAVMLDTVSIATALGPMIGRWWSSAIGWLLG